MFIFLSRSPCGVVVELLVSSPWGLEFDLYQGWNFKIKFWKAFKPVSGSRIDRSGRPVSAVEHVTGSIGQTGSDHLPVYGQTGRTSRSGPVFKTLDYSNILIVIIIQCKLWSTFIYEFLYHFSKKDYNIS